MKILTWIGEDGYFKGQDLLSGFQVLAIIPALKHHELYCSIHDYNKDGSIAGCPLLFDIDSESLIDAYKEMHLIREELIVDFDIDPLIYFSGGKGFHIATGLYIKHERCHEIAAMIASEYSEEIDTSIYRTKSMLRVNGSRNVKSKRWKVRVNPATSLDAMVLQSELGLQWSSPDTQKTIQIDPSLYTSKLRELSDTLEPSTLSEMMPCIRKLWNNEDPEEGTRHYSIVIMARFFNGAGYTMEEVFKLYARHPFWKDINPRDYEKVISSIYRTNKTKIGCKNGRDADMLQPYCQKVCRFNTANPVTSWIAWE